MLKSKDVSKRSVDPCYCISYSIPLHHQVEEEFNMSHQKECPIAAVIVEPIQAEGGESDIEFHGVRLHLVHVTCFLTGDVHASPEFFIGLQTLCKKVSELNHYL